MRLFVTGFGPFGDVTENPSAWLAERSGAPFEVLAVTFEAIDAFFDAFDPLAWDALLMMGVAHSADKMRLESIARNGCGSVADVDHVIQGPAPIDPFEVAALSGGLWRPEHVHLDERLVESVNAGDYLCNAMYFQALRRAPQVRSGFLHVPPPTAIPLEAQLDVLHRLIAAID